MNTSHIFRPADRPDQHGTPVPGALYRIGRTIIKRGTSEGASRATSKKTSRYGTPHNTSPATSPHIRPKEDTLDRDAISLTFPTSPIDVGESSGSSPRVGSPGSGPVGRSIMFHDEQKPHGGGKEKKQVEQESEV
jgi:hypothetical protein